MPASNTGFNISQKGFYTWIRLGGLPIRFGNIDLIGTVERCFEIPPKTHCTGEFGDASLKSSERRQFRRRNKTKTVRKQTDLRSAEGTRRTVMKSSVRKKVS